LTARFVSVADADVSRRKRLGGVSVAALFGSFYTPAFLFPVSETPFSLAPFL